MERFWRLVDTSGDCWLWCGSVDRYGYGRFKLDHRAARVHRYSYELRYGPIGAGLVIDHLCLTKHCVRPEHMEVVTPGENTRRAGRRKIRCANGHPYSAANTYWRPSGQRDCRACIRARVRAYNARRAAA